MSIGSFLKEQLKDFKKREKEVKKLLTEMYDGQRNKSIMIDIKELNELKNEMNTLRKKIKQIMSLIRTS